MVTRFSLLVADDDPESLEDLSLVLERQGYRVLRASSGLEAFEIARQETVHASVIEMAMADLSGVDMLQRLYKENFKIPCILVSTEPWKEMQMAALAVGAFAFIQKPVQEEILRNSIAKLLDRNFADSPPHFAIQVYQQKLNTKEAQNNDDKNKNRCGD